MSWKIFLPLFFAALLFVAGSTSVMAGRYGGNGGSYYGHRAAPHSGYYGRGHDYRGNKHAGPGYHDGWRYHRKLYHYGPSFTQYRSYPHGWYGGPFGGGTLFLPGWGMVFRGYGQW
jgi:hypothetical protein